MAGGIERRHLVLVWGVGILLLGGAVAFLLARGDVRTVLLVLLTVLGLLCLSPRRGVFIILLFLPFMYFLRRQVLYFNEFSQKDPILIFPSLVTIAMFLGFIIFYSERLYHYVRRSALMKAILALLVLFGVQIFNPLQGNLLIGMAGAIYFIVPALWVFMGLLVEPRDVRRILLMVVAIGAVTAMYGIYQHYFGISDVERYELESKGFFKAFGARARSMSTFAGLADFSVYLANAGFLAFAHFWRTKRNPILLGLFALMAFAMVWVANRTSILVLLFTVTWFLIVYSRRPGLVLARGALALVVVAGLYAYFYSRTSEEIYAAHGSDNPFIAHTVAGVTRPTDESTFRIRLGIWEYIVSSAVTRYPFGRGLGSTTTAARKFEGGKMQEAESYFFELIHGSGLLAGALYLVVMGLILRDGLSLSFRAPDDQVYKIVLGLMGAFFLGSLFGLSLRDTISSPLAWLLIGWIIREAVDRREEAALPAAAAA
jgi:hypothetical protein